VVDVVENNIKLDLREEKIYSIRDFWSWMNFFVVLLCVLGAFTILRSGVFMCVQVSGSSMYPTVTDKDYLLVQKTDVVRRGDVIVFYSETLDRLLIKRVIALQGDTIYTSGGDVYLKKNGADDFEKISEDYTRLEHSTWRYAHAAGEEFGPMKIPEGKVFVMGDNRTESLDSRVLGSVSLADVQGIVTQFVIDYRYNLQFLYRIF